MTGRGQGLSSTVQMEVGQRCRYCNYHAGKERHWDVPFDVIKNAFNYRSSVVWVGPAYNHFDSMKDT